MFVPDNSIHTHQTINDFENSWAHKWVQRQTAFKCGVFENLAKKFWPTLLLAREFPGKGRQTCRELRLSRTKCAK